MQNITLSNAISCLSSYDPNALPVDDARAIIRQLATPVDVIEHVPLTAALGRTLATDIVSPINVPAHDNSAMDGYALRGTDLHADAAVTLQIIGTAYAGRAYDGEVDPGQCVRIMTGAVMPAGCDTVAPQELTQVDDTSMTIPARAIRQGDHRRLRGEDLAAGKTALAAGKILRPADLGLLASLGIGKVPVRRRLRVAFFSTGDELRAVGEPLDEGCVYDSNRYTLYGMLQRMGCDVLDFGIVRDEPEALESAFRAACEAADAVITTGGVSVGEADYTKQIMAKLGDVTFWKIAMRPGRPMAFGRVSSNGKSACLFGLPGNPVAVMVTFYFLVRDALLQMMGASGESIRTMRARSQHVIRKKPGRTEYQRGIVSKDDAGNVQVQITGSQGSGILRSMSEANCMVVLPHEQGNVAEGEMVEIVPFEGLI